jgi:hypothetical protein
MGKGLDGANGKGKGRNGLHFRRFFEVGASES